MINPLGSAGPPRLVTAFLLATGVACTSTITIEDPPTSAQTTAPATQEAATDYWRWEEEARLLADELVEEARQLAAEGRRSEALDRIDDALCEVLSPPEGYEPRSAYMDYVALLLNEAESIEEGLDELDVGDEDELVTLPPVEVAEGPEIVDPRSLSSLPESDFPLILNSTVTRFLEAMMRPGEYRTRIETGLERSGKYLPMIREQFRRAGLPEDLAYLPLIESAFSVRAYSKARAHGMWQFIASTGRHYGLEIGPLVDERRDPVRSTEAAVAHLDDLYRSFKDWYLALAAYNSGSGNVRRAIRRSGSRDFWRLRRNLPRETRNYVPAFIASVVIADQPSRFGFPTPVEQPWLFDEIAVPDALDLEFLATHINIDVEDLRHLNPAIRRDLTLARRTTTVRLPQGYGETAAAVLESVPRAEWAPRMVHTVRSGDSLYTIAQQYNSSVSAIRQANGIRGSLIRPGQTLVVPRHGQLPPQPERKVAASGSYTVQRRDTLWDIAQAFAVSLDQLCAANGLSRSSVIHPGQRLQIPDDSTASAGAVRPRAPDSDVQHYKVRRGDTLYDIARRFGVTVSELRRANGINGSRIYPGDLLRIPTSRARG